MSLIERVVPLPEAGPDSVRYVADGVWCRCLCAERGTDLQRVLRAGATRANLLAVIADHWSSRRDQGAVDRLALAEAQQAQPVHISRRDPHQEMHTRTRQFKPMGRPTSTGRPVVSHATRLACRAIQQEGTG